MALAPFPPGCAGWRMQRLSGLSPDEWMARVDRRNASDPDAVSFSPGDVVLLLGEDVRAASDVPVPRLLIHPQTIDGVTYRQVPHPSGRNRVYNDPVMRWLLEETVREHLSIC